MKYLQFIWADGMPSAQDIEAINREIPAFDAEIAPRGIRLLGRELDLPSTAATVRTRDDQVIVSDGPYAETKEFIAGFGLLECSSLDEVLEVAAKNPIARFSPLEIREFISELPVNETVSAFGRGADGDLIPFLLLVWVPRFVDLLSAPEINERPLAWRARLMAERAYILGSSLGDLAAARTVSVRDGETVVTEGSFSRIAEYVAAIELLNCVDHRQAIDRAGTHPLAAHYAIEVRPFYRE